MTSKTIGSYIFLISLIVFSSLTICNAKPKSWSQNGLQGSQGMGDNDYINLFNGRLNFTLPLVSMSGRGGIGTVIPFTIENNVWRYHVHYEPRYIDYPGTGPQIHCTSKYPYTTVTADGETTGGFETTPIETCTQTSAFTATTRIMLDPHQFHFVFAQDKGLIDPGYGPGVLYGEYERRSNYRHDISNYSGPLNIPNVGSGRTTLTLKMPDGSSVLFVDTKTMGRYKGYGFVNSEIDYYSREKNFTTIDGSSMSFISDEEILDGNGGWSAQSPTSQSADFFPSGYVLSKDGSKTRIEDGLIKWVQDVNGNRTSYSYTPPPNPSTPRRVSQITDSLGRSILFSYDINDSELAPDGMPYGLRDEITYPGIGGSELKTIITKADLTNTLRSDFVPQTYSQLWSMHSSGNYNTIFNKPVVSAVWNSDGKVVKFKYDSFGNLSRVIYPNGGATEYDYDFGFGQNYSSVSKRRRVVEKRLYRESSDPTSLINKTTFSDIYSGSTQPVTTQPVQVDQRDSSNNLLSRQKHYFIGDPLNFAQSNQFARIHGLEQDLAGKETKTEIINPVSQQVYRRIEYSWQFRVPGSRPYYTIYQGVPYAYERLHDEVPSVDPILVEIKTTLEPNVGGGLVTKTTSISPFSGAIGFDAYNNQTDIWEFDYGVGDAPAIPARHRQTDYLTVNPVNNVNYSTPANGQNYVMADLHIRSLPIASKLFSIDPGNGVETLLSQSETKFDEPAYPIISESAAPGWHDPLHGNRGNPTTSRTWYQDENRWISTHAQFDQFGNLRKAWDASDDPSRFTETQYSSAYAFGFPTKVIAPAPDPTNTTGTNQTSTAETTYDFTTGLPLTVKDDFGQITRTEYDAQLRPIRVFADNFTAPESQTIYGVPNTSGQLPPDQRFVKVRKQIDANNWDEAITWFDGLGRTIQTTAKDSQGDVKVDTHYDQFGRVERVTNPYRQGETVLWAKTRYDAMGRAVETYAPATLADVTANNLTSIGVTSFDISNVNNASGNFIGTVVTTTDASGRKGRSITNALGQLLRVDEPTGISGSAEADLGPLDQPIQPTLYKYDVKGNMVEVTQGVQKRWFKYDSLGRLIRVRQPEQEVNASLHLADAFNTSGGWTAGFAYDLMGNVVRATDANGVNIINDYDRANRVIRRCYTKPEISTSAVSCVGVAGPDISTTTPAVLFFYDGKGLAQQQSPHNYAKGKLTKVTSTVSETQYQLFDNLGRLMQSAQITDGQTYTSSYQYNLSGALVQETYPSGRVVKNEFESDGDLLKVTSQKNASSVFATYVSNFSYTASGGISQMRLGNGRWETAKFNNRMQVTELGLGNSATDASVWKTAYEYGELDSNGNVVTAKNTGNIAKQTLTVPGTSFTQSYKYDSLYRLKEAVEKTGTETNWSQVFDYDRYGNRIFLNQSIGSLNLNTTPAVDVGTNRFTSTDYGYDKNGNVIADIDQISNLPRQFIFNGDNKQSEVKRDGVTIGRYHYDGEGKRIKKVTDTETTVFVYSSGKLIAEYSTQISQTPSVAYTTTDHLGTPRIITNELGQVKARRDFMPFGEELYVNVGGRTPTLNYGTSEDDIRQKFTGYQKDNETNLDFAEARMYANNFGRFTAVDPLLASGRSANPQTFNRYVYVGNSPLSRKDPTGLDWYFLNGSYRWSSDNRYFDKSIYSAVVKGELINPTSVKGWTRVSLDGNGEFRYFTAGSAPGKAQEIILSTGGRFDPGREIIYDPEAFAKYQTEQAATSKLIADMLGAVIEAREMDNAIRPLTDVRTGSSPRTPRMDFVFDRMQPDSNGMPRTGASATSLGPREKDINFFEGSALPGNGKSVSGSPLYLPPFKQDAKNGSIFCLPCRNLPNGLRIRMDPENSGHLFLEPSRSMPVNDFGDLLNQSRPFWFRIDYE